MAKTRQHPRKNDGGRNRRRTIITLYHVGYYDPLKPDKPPRIIGRAYDGSPDDQENMRLAMKECNRILAADSRVFAVISSFPVLYEIRPAVARLRR